VTGDSFVERDRLRTDVAVNCDARGVIWTSDGVGSPQAHGYDVDAFVGAMPKLGIATVRLIGTRANCHLVPALWRCVPNQATIAGPNPLRGELNTDDAALLPAWFNMISVPPSLGGWRPITSLDAASCGLANQVYTRGAHPVIERMRFVTGLNVTLLGQVVAAIRDPRWFVDLENPDRMSRLSAYFGLVPRDSSRRRGGWAEKVHACWSGGIATPDAPGAFLPRMLRRSRADPSVATVRVSIAFLSLLRQVWLEEIYAGDPRRPAACRETMFAPDRFFERDLRGLSAWRAWGREDPDVDRAQGSG
jgi:hypothetical protein